VSVLCYLPFQILRDIIYSSLFRWILSHSRMIFLIQMPKNRIMNRSVADSINFSDEWFMCFSDWIVHEKVFTGENTYFEVSEFVSETRTESEANEIFLEERLDRIDAAVHFHSKTIEHHHTLIGNSKTKIRYCCWRTIQIIRKVEIGRFISSSARLFSVSLKV
jgi:hypothetical protein